MGMSFGDESVAKKYTNVSRGGSQGRSEEGWRMLAVAKWMRGHLASLVDSLEKRSEKLGSFVLVLTLALCLQGEN